MSLQAQNCGAGTATGGENTLERSHRHGRFRSRRRGRQAPFTDVSRRSVNHVKGRVSIRSLVSLRRGTRTPRSREASVLSRPLSRASSFAPCVRSHGRANSRFRSNLYSRCASRLLLHVEAKPVRATQGPRAPHVSRSRLHVCRRPRPEWCTRDATEKQARSRTLRIITRVARRDHVSATRR